MDPNEQIQNNIARMKAAAQARKSRPVTGLVSSTGISNSSPASSGGGGGGGPSGGGLNSSLSSSNSVLSNSSNIVGSSARPASCSIGSSKGLDQSFTSSFSAVESKEETEGQLKIRKQLERVGIAPTFDVTSPITSPSSRRNEQKAEQTTKLDVCDTRSFLGLPPPKVGMIQCHIIRDKSGNKYDFFLDDGSMFLLSSVKRKQNKTSNYLISLDQNDLSRDSGHFYGKLRSNFLGTEFTVFDKGEKPNVPAVASSSGNAMSKRQEMASVVYERNILGTKGPRKMFVLIPTVDDGGKRVLWKPEKEEDSLISQFRKGNVRDMMILKNKEPSWNEQLRAFVLNFGGRVTMPSVKNFQLVDQENPAKVLLQFGKVDTNKFTLDFQYPICGLQAFGVALSAFDGKLACE